MLLCVCLLYYYYYACEYQVGLKKNEKIKAVNSLYVNCNFLTEINTTTTTTDFSFSVKVYCNPVLWPVRLLTYLFPAVMRYFILFFHFCKLCDLALVL